MSVFKIQQRGIEMQDQKGSATEIESDADLSKEGNVQFQDASKAAETPVESASGEPVEKPDLMVKIDGPVGRVFTDALNKLLVQESYMMMSPSLFEDKDKTEDLDEDKEVGLQVYCWKGEELNIEDVTAITSDIAKHQNRDFVIAIESARITPVMALLGDLEKLPNVRLCYSQEKALSIVSERIKK